MPVRDDLASRTLGFLRHGDFQEELSEAIAECVKASDEHGKDSSLTIKLKFESKRGQVFIYDDIGTKPAKPTNPASIAFADVHGNLSRTDPRQGNLDIRPADETPDEVRKVNHDG